MIRRRLLAALLPILAASCATTPHVEHQAVGAPLRLASWNLEFLAEQDHAGCRPRNAADYAAMRRIADSLDADVIAFQEAESIGAAERIFDPARYTIVMEARTGEASGTCGGAQSGQAFIRQAVGFAVRKDVAFERAPDTVELQLGNPNLRSGVDITIRPARGRALRLLAVHLKSGCFSGSTASACPVLLQQVPALERWIDAAAGSSTRFAVLGDWNRRVAQAGDPIWAELDDASPRNADLTLADQGTAPRCDPRYRDFIDHIALDRRASRDLMTFREITYATDVHYSDHCPILVELRR